MKHKTFRSFIVMAILLPGLLFLVHSCKKSENGASPAEATELANAKAALKEKIRKEGWSVTIPVNQKIGASYVDRNGKEVPKEELMRRSHGSSAGSIISSCDYSNSPTVLLNSYTLYFNCTTGYQVSWNYTVSTNNNIVATSPYNSSQVSKGKFYIYNSSNTLIYSNTAVTPAAVSDIGADPMNGGYELFSVTFSTGWLPLSDFDGAYTTKLGALLVTDCSDIEAFPIALQNYSATAYQYPSTQPCSRIDPIYFNSYSPIRIWGEDPIGTCTGTGYVYPDLQEINFSIDGGAWIGGSTASTYLSYYLPPPSWTPYPNFNSAHLGYVDPYGVMILQLTGLFGPHNIAVRERNIVYYNPASSYTGGVWPVPNPGTNCCAGSWSSTTTYSVTY